MDVDAVTETVDSLAAAGAVQTPFDPRRQGFSSTLGCTLIEPSTILGKTDFESFRFTVVEGGSAPTFRFGHRLIMPVHLTLDNVCG